MFFSRVSIVSLFILSFPPESDQGRACGDRLGWIKKVPSVSRLIKSGYRLFVIIYYAEQKIVNYTGMEIPRKKHAEDDQWRYTV